jgi:licheninase
MSMSVASTQRSRRNHYRLVGLLAGAVILLALFVALPITPTATPEEPADNCRATAAAAHGWGSPDRSDDFNDPSSLAGWSLYKGAGLLGNGRLTPEAVSVDGGNLTITGDAAGNTEGMAWWPGQLFGRWEVCVKSPPAAPAYHSVSLLWPDAEDWPVGGEIDFMEISDPTRQNIDAYMHFGADDQREGGNVNIDATQWHAWAVEWTPDHVATYVDGALWWSTSDAANIPRRAMHLCMQLDDFGGDTSQGGQQVVDWVRQYPAP